MVSPLCILNPHSNVLTDLVRCIYKLQTIYQTVSQVTIDAVDHARIYLTTILRFTSLEDKKGEFYC